MEDIKTTSITIRVSEVEKEQLKKIATQTDTTISQLLRKMIRDCLKEVK